MFMASLATLKPQLRFNPLKPTINNFVFSLHYKVTVILLVLFVVLVCSREYFGEHIRCISDQGVPPHVIQTYCFFMATFTIVRHYNESLLQTGFLPHPGVGPILDSDETIPHKYYQWVPFVLLFQSICFYMPHYIWKKKEGGRIKALVDGLQLASLSVICRQDMTVNGQPLPSKSSLNHRLDIVRKDIVLRLRISRTWSVWLVTMEIVNLINIIMQIWLTNLFLHGAFMDLGPRVWRWNWDQMADPLEIVFPKVTKCVFHKYGPSGSIQQHDALCVMALNIIHEKIFTVMWFWFLFLFIASVLGLIWRIMTFFLYRRSMRFNSMAFKHASSGMFNPYQIIQVVNGCQFGDWLFLYYLAKNMNGFVFQELFKRLAEELSSREIPEYEADDSSEKVNVVNVISYDDETLPLKTDDKKLS